MKPVTTVFELFIMLASVIDFPAFWQSPRRAVIRYSHNTDGAPFWSIITLSALITLLCQSFTLYSYLHNNCQ